MDGFGFSVTQPQPIMSSSGTQLMSISGVPLFSTYDGYLMELPSYCYDNYGSLVTGSWTFVPHFTPLPMDTPYVPTDQLIDLGSPTMTPPPDMSTAEMISAAMDIDLGRLTPPPEGDAKPSEDVKRSSSTESDSIPSEMQRQGSEEVLQEAMQMQPTPPLDAASSGQSPPLPYYATRYITPMDIPFSVFAPIIPDVSDAQPDFAGQAPAPWGYNMESQWGPPAGNPFPETVPLPVSDDTLPMMEQPYVSTNTYKGRQRWRKTWPRKQFPATNNASSATAQRAGGEGSFKAPTVPQPTKPILHTVRCTKPKDDQEGCLECIAERAQSGAYDYVEHNGPYYKTTPLTRRGQRIRRPKKAPKYFSTEQLCRFCLSNKETPFCFKSHVLFDASGKVTCPILRKLVCPICGKTGDEAHTFRYCPFNRNTTKSLFQRNSVYEGVQFTRNSSGDKLLMKY